MPPPQLVPTQQMTTTSITITSDDSETYNEYEGAIQNYKSRIMNTTSKSYNSNNNNSKVVNVPKGISIIKTQENLLNDQTTTFGMTNLLSQDLPKIDISKKKEMFENQSPIIEMKMTQNRLSTHIMANTKSVKERLSSLGVNGNGIESEIDNEVVQDVQLNNMTSLKDRLSSLEKYQRPSNDVIGSTSKIDVPIVSLKDRLSSLHSNVGLTDESIKEISTPIIMVKDSSNNNGRVPVELKINSPTNDRAQCNNKPVINFSNSIVKKVEMEIPISANNAIPPPLPPPNPIQSTLLTSTPVIVPAQQPATVMDTDDNDISVSNCIYKHSSNSDGKLLTELQKIVDNFNSIDNKVSDANIDIKKNQLKSNRRKTVVEICKKIDVKKDSNDMGSTPVTPIISVQKSDLVEHVDVDDWNDDDIDEILDEELIKLDQIT